MPRRRSSSHFDPPRRRRTRSGHRRRSSFLRLCLGELDHLLAGKLFRSVDGYSGESRNGPPGLASARLRLQTAHLDRPTQSTRTRGLGGKRLRVEILLTAAAHAVEDAQPFPTPVAPSLTPDPLLYPPPDQKRAFDWHTVVDPDHWDQVPADVPELHSLLPRADLNIEDEVDIR